MPKNEKKPQVRCAIYTRKSTEEGLDQEFNSLDAQREAGEAFVASQKHEGWVALPNRYDDGGFSGGTAERPGLHRLLTDIEAGAVDCVVVYKVDRLSRSLLDFARMMESFEKHDVSFVSVTQQFNTSHSMGRLTLNILLSFAQFEREIIGERIRDKLDAQRRKGKWAGGIPVLGYDVDRSGASPKLVVNKSEAARVRQIYELYLSLGSLLPVIQELEKRDWTNKRWTTKAGVRKGGTAFDRSTLYMLLRNPIYIGKAKHRGQVFDGEHEPIVPAELFQAVQARLKYNRQTGGANVRNKHGALLKGLLFCKRCDRAMTHTFTGSGNRRYRYYTCMSAIKKGRCACRSRSLPATEIENAVVTEIRVIANDSKLRSTVVLEAQSHIADELEVLDAERLAVERDLQWHDAEIRAMPAAEITSDLEARVGRAQNRLAEIQERIGDLKITRVTADDVSNALADFETTWSKLSPREQWQLLGLLIARVEFDPRNLNFEICFQNSGIRSLAK